MKLRIMSVIISIFALITTLYLHAQTTDAPPNVAAALTMKLVSLEKKISAGGDITIYVISAPKVADELKKGIGKKIGKATLKNVESGSDLPAAKPTFIFVGKKADVSTAIEYSRKNKILSVTGTLDYVNQGVSLGIGVGGGKPKIVLNLSASVEESLDWNPAIMKVAKTIK